MAQIFVELWNAANSSKIANVSTDGTTHHGVLSCSVASRRMAVAQAQLVVRRDHPQVANLVRGNHLRWFIGGVHAHTTRIISTTDTRVSPSGPSGEVLTILSESHAQILSEGVVRPYGGENFRPTSQSRSFGAHAPETPTTSWPAAVLQYSGVASPIAGVPGFEPWVSPDGHPGPLDEPDWIAAEDAPASTPGIYPLRFTFTNPATQDLWICASSDDGCRVFMDGSQLIDWTVRYPGEGSFRSLWRNIVRGATAGDHEISIELEVLPGTPSGPRRGMATVSIHKLPPAGTILGPSTYIAGTSTAWKCRTTPGDFPACNPHQAFDALLDDAQAVDMCDGVTLSSTASVDANSNAWNTEVPAALAVGSKLSSVLDGWRDGGAVEWKMDKASQVLRLYRPGGLGSASSAVFTDAVDLDEDATTTDGNIINTLLVQTEDGWELTQRAASVSTHGAVGDTLNLSGASSPATRASAVDAFFDLEATPKTSRTVAVKPATAADLPGAFDAGDTVTVDGAEVRVEMWSASQSGNGLATFALELVTSTQIAAERDQLRLDMAAAGTAGGRSAVATIWQPAGDLPSGKLERRDFPVFSPDDDPVTLAQVTGTQKEIRNGDGPRRVTLFEVKGLWTPAGDRPYVSGTSGPRVPRTNYVAAVQRNGTNIAVITLTPDDFESIALIEDGLFSETDYFRCAGFGGVGLSDVVMSTTAVEAI
ncbi:MAG: hypothetical protein ACK5O2_00570 [Microthrixaceae bacterium]